MANETTDHLSIDIGKELDALCLVPSGGSIFMVPEHLRNVHEKSYEPLILSIGPYHRGKNQLKAMEDQKKRYLKLLLERRKEKDVTKYVMALRPLEKRARKCYAESLSLAAEDFVKMMLFDGCFIVELLRKNKVKELIDDSDPIFKGEWMFNLVYRDLLLVENQIPFFVLQEIFGMTLNEGEPNDLSHMISHFFHELIPGHEPKQVQEPLNDSAQNIKHLLSYLHNERLPSSSGIKYYKNWVFILSAIELKEAGIKFKKVEGDGLFNIKFENGILKVPTLTVDDHTESFFRNLIAYEQLFVGESLNYVTDYVRFIDCLINTPKDVELLIKCGIISNCLGDNEVVANMFNKLRDNVTGSYYKFYYSELFIKVNKHCGRRWNKWFANLRHKYFNTPWTLISFLAAVLLLLLTMTQTVFSVFEYIKK